MARNVATTVLLAGLEAISVSEGADRCKQVGQGYLQRTMAG